MAGKSPHDGGKLMSIGNAINHIRDTAETTPNKAFTASFHFA
jgi:hypothetical protein